MSTLAIDAGYIPQANFPTERSRAEAILGAKNISFFEHDCALHGIVGVFPDGASGGSDLFQPGCVQFVTTLLAGSYARYSAAYQGGFSQAFAGGQNWFCSSRFRVDSVPDANTEMFVGLNDSLGTNPLRLGVYGAVSTANYVLQGPVGTPMDSGIAIDASYHTFRAFRRGGTTYMQVDDVTVTGNVDTAGNTSPTVMCKTNAIILAAQKMSIQWFCGAAVLS